MEAERHTAETQSPEGSERSGEAAQPVDGVLAVWLRKQSLVKGIQTTPHEPSKGTP
jgi:hypothetical protein